MEKLMEQASNLSGLTIAAGKQKTLKSLQRKNFRVGAGDRTRTGTLSPAVDFESTTSTNSITPAGAGLIILYLYAQCK